ncbi:glycosyltransferase family 2 protein [Candidatus Woesearchaeota archaeon]|nr:glycosyltransferase family 2 protein [Candidatus Woesearchaeota archaeon]
MKLSIIIPAYNEENTIKKIIQDSQQALLQVMQESDFEIIVMNDCSKDNTLKYCEEMQKKLKNLRIFSNHINFGKTLNLMRGFDLSHGEYVGFIDADYQYDPKDLPNLFKKVQEGYDVVCGYRKLRKDSMYRKFMSWGFNTFNRVFFGIKVSDVNCGLKIIKKTSLPKLNIKYLRAKWFIDTEFLVRAYEKNFKITELPINHYNRREGNSKVSGLKLMLETLLYGLLLKSEIIIRKVRHLFK